MSIPVASFTDSNTFAITAGTFPATSLTPFEFPPITVTLSIALIGSATFLATSGKTFTSISTIAACPYFFIASAFLSIASASANPFALIASASASPFALIARASCSCLYFSASALVLVASASRSISTFLASASLVLIYNLASASCSCLYFSASAFFLTSASNACSITSTSLCFNSTSRSRFAISAFVEVCSIVFLCSCFWISYAASASALFVSETFNNSDFFISNSLFFCAISKSAFTRASLASLSASAFFISTSLSASAFAIAASFLIFAVLSIPMFLIRSLSSSTFCILHDIISIPNFFMSTDAFSWTWLPNSSLLLQTPLKVSVPIISRILPCKESCKSCVISCSDLFKKFFIASFISKGSDETLTFATASTFILIKSIVGIYPSVFISTVICFNNSLSSLSKNGIRIPALPINIFGCLLKPEIIYAISGGALTYPVAHIITIANTIATINTIKK